MALLIAAMHYTLMVDTGSNILRQAVRERVLVGQHRGGTPRELPNGRIPVPLGGKKYVQERN